MIRECLAIFLLLFPFVPKGQTSEGLVAKLTFNQGEAKDDLGHLSPKIYGAKLVEDRFGNPNSAYYFQGNFDSYLNLGTTKLLKPKNGSISLWVKIDQQMFKGEGFHGNPVIRTRSHAGDDFDEAYSMTYHFNLRKLNCNTTHSELKQTTVYPSDITYLQQWYHLVMTYDSKTLTFYINGVLEGKSAKNFESRFLEGDSVIVGMTYGLKNKRYLQGTVDDIRIYNRVISPKEVFDLYNDPNPNKSAVIMRWIALCLLCLAVVLGVVALVRWRINRLLAIEKEKNQLRNNWYEQENKVLTAQMDPHFIFNALNAIQQFIIINDNEKAQLYLTRFSRLLRMILESNLKDTIMLGEEIKIIEQYLEIESLRFNNVFQYNISIGRDIYPEKTFIPRYLIQPFVENAIWHGLLPKEGEKLLAITFEYKSEKALLCTIEDNGVGRKEEKDPPNNKTSRSLAIAFIRQRLQLMTKLYKETYELTIIDNVDDRKRNTGTTVEIIIPILKP